MQPFIHYFPTVIDLNSSLSQSNRCTRSRTFRHCYRTKSSNRSRTILLRIQTFICYFLKTLTTLDLCANQIGPQGAEYLAYALQQNQVIRFALFCFHFNHSFIISHRHWWHFNSITTKSAIKERNIWPMHYKKTK
jgi:hypothetical protein